MIWVFTVISNEATAVQQQTLRLLAFDCLVVDNENVMSKPLEKRYGVGLSPIMPTNHSACVDPGAVEAQRLVLSTLRSDDARLSSYGRHPTF